MRYLIDIGHPAHIHYFRNFAKSVKDNNHEVLFTCRDKEVTISLLEHYSFKYINLGRPFKSLPGKFFGLFYFTFRILLVSKQFKPDMLLNASMYSAFVAWLLNKPHISLEDTFNKEQVMLYSPFTSCILTGDYKHPALGKKEIRYKGYQELLYLHPNRFKPDKAIFEELGLKENDPYVILRFVSWNASHDVGHNGIVQKNKIKAINEFSKYAKVFISSEADLPEELLKYKISIPVYRMHDAIAFATLLFGESSTMSEEAAMLGVPSIYLYDFSTYYTLHLEKEYGLMYNFSESEEDQIKAIELGKNLLAKSILMTKFKESKDKMLSNKIDVTAFLIWFIESWPESFKIMKENPEYQDRFR